MASGDDPLADYQNMLGLQGLTGPNPYLKYSGQIPMAGFYTGQAGNQPPTDAQGNPISSFVNANNAAQSQYQQQLAAFNAGQGQQPGTTLNSTPNSTPPGVIPFQHATMPDGMPYGQTSLGRGVTGTSWQGPGGGTMPQQGPAAGSAATPPSPPDMRQAYLDALANPGKVNTPGAQMLPGTSPTAPLGANQQPSVMQAFLNAHAQAQPSPTQPAGGGPANMNPTPSGFNNSGFFNTLNQLQQRGP